MISANGSDPRMREHELEILSSRLGGYWDFASGSFEPSEHALAMHARERRMPMQSAAWLKGLKALYLPLTVTIGAAYAVTVGDLSGWEGPLAWLNRAAIAMAFAAGSLLAASLWRKEAKSRYLEPARWFRNRLGLAVAATAGLLLVDFTASYTLFAGATETASLGSSRTPPLVVPLLAGLTTFAQLLGAVVGHETGVREEVEASWRARLAASRAQEFERIAAVACAIRQDRRDRQAAEELPIGHIDRSG